MVDRQTWSSGLNGGGMVLAGWWIDVSSSAHILGLGGIMPSPSVFVSSVCTDTAVVMTNSEAHHFASFFMNH